MLKILIAEDDVMIADMLEEILTDHGYEVCGLARTVDEAVMLARLHRPALAIIDMRLADDGLGTDIVAQLDHPRIGVLYATGNNKQFKLTAADGDACIAKPYRTDHLLRAVEIVAEIVATGTGSPPFPRGFQLLDRPTPQ